MIKTFVKKPMTMEKNKIDLALRLLDVKYFDVMEFTSTDKYRHLIIILL